MLEKLKPSKKTVLDIGSGTGEFLSALKKSGWTTRGLEPNEKAREMAKQKYSLVMGNTSEIVEEVDHSWDVITMWHVLEHVHKLDDMIRQLKRILKENGSLVIAVPNVTSFDANLYKKEWAAFDLPRHLYHFSQTHMEMLFDKVNMKIVKVIPMYFDSYYVSMLSERYKKGKTNPGTLAKAFLNGFRSNKKGKKNNSNYSSLIYILKNGE